MSGFDLNQTKPFDQFTPYLIYLIPLLFLLSGCTKGCSGGSLGGNGVNLETMPHVPLCNPVNIVYRRSYAVALDDKSQVWQWQFDKNYNIVNVEKVKLSNVYSAGLNIDQSMGWAINKQGKVWFWNLHNPSNVEQHKTDKPVKKMVANGYYLAFLHIDGTITSNGGVSQTGLGAPDTKNNSIDYSQFTDIKDIYWGGTYLVALTETGQAIAACGRGLNDLIIESEPTKDAKPVTIKGLASIKRFYQKERFYYAITEANEIYYWSQGFRGRGIQTLDVKGNNIAYGRVLTSNGTNYELIDTKKYGADLKIGGSQNLDQPQGYGLWYLDYTAKKAVGLDIEGKLWLYDYNSRDQKGTRLSNPQRIGNFTVKLDYYKY